MSTNVSLPANAALMASRWCGLNPSLPNTSLLSSASRSDQGKSVRDHAASTLERTEAHWGGFFDTTTCCCAEMDEPPKGLPPADDCCICCCCSGGRTGWNKPLPPAPPLEEAALPPTKEPYDEPNDEDAVKVLALLKLLLPPPPYPPAPLLPLKLLETGRWNAEAGSMPDCCWGTAGVKSSTKQSAYSLMSV
jgi:hypothetical protein